MNNKPSVSNNFDLLIITHLPAFYKIYLYNNIAKRHKIFVLFIGSGSNIRVEDFTAGKINFSYGYLNQGEFESRNILKSCVKLLYVLIKNKFNGLIVNGWELPEFWLAIFLSRTRRGLALESTDLESNIKGLKRTLKEVFLSRVHFALPSGIPHERLLKALKFKGNSAITGGVGFTSVNTPVLHSNKKKIYKAIYVGRLSKEKNLTFLISVVNTLENIELTMVGTGPQFKELQEIAGPNVRFIGHVDNSQLNEVFAMHHFLILSSISETWGLVVEEALQALLPVIVSDAVGCSEDLVSKLDTGLVFKSGSKDELTKAIKDITIPSVYKRFVANASAINWSYRRECQVVAYGSLGTKSGYSSTSIL